MSATDYRDPSEIIRSALLIRFYNNQVRKDEELSIKIAWFQAKVGTRKI